MKLFEVSYVIDGFSPEEIVYLSVGTSEEEVEQRERIKLKDENYMALFVSEINSVDGYKIQLIKED